MARTRTGDQRWVREQDKRLRLQQLQDEADLREMLAIPAAQRYMTRLIVKTGVFSGGFEPNGSRLYAREGVRSFGLDMVRDVSKVCPGFIEAILKPPEDVDDLTTGPVIDDEDDGETE